MDQGAPKLAEESDHEEAASSPALASVTAASANPRIANQAPIPGRKISYWTLLVLTAGALYLAFIIYRPFLKVLFLALVLTIAFWPIDRWISKRIRNNTARALVTTLSVVIVIMLPLLFVSLNLVSEAAATYRFVMEKTAGNWSGHFSWLT